MKIESGQLEELREKLPFLHEPILQKLGITEEKGYLISPECARGPALCHNGDNPTGFSYYFETGHWRCWTHDCHERYGDDFIGLIRAISGKSFQAAVEEAAAILKEHDWKLGALVGKPKNKAQAKLQTENVWQAHITQKSYPDTLLTNLNSAFPYAQQRGIDFALFQKHGIGYAFKGSLSKRIVVPIRNALGSIVGFSGRYIHYEKGCTYPKWQHWPSSKSGLPGQGFRKDYNFFNFHNVLNHVHTHKDRSVILVEGPFDVLKMEMAGIQNAMAVLGDSLTNGQVELLKHCHFVEVILAFDQDEAGKLANERVARKLEKHLFKLDVILAREGADWGVMTPDEIREALKQRSSV